MAIITTVEVKALLGIPTGTTTYDADIALKIPEIESTVKRMTHNRFTLQVKGDVLVAVGSNKQGVFAPNTITSAGTMIFDGGNYLDTTLDDCLYIGQCISGSGIPAGSFIQDIYSDSGTVIDGVTYGIPIITISGTVTATDDVTAYTNIPTGLKPIIAKGIFWLIKNQSMSFDDTAWTSRSVGPLSVSRSEMDAKADGLYGMPAWFNKAIPRFHV